MRSVHFRFHAGRFAAGATLVSVGAGVGQFAPALLWPAALVFLSGVAMTGSGVVAFAPRTVTVHPRWDNRLLHRALRTSPPGTTVRIQQTWFPEESLIAHLRSLYLYHDKEFSLRVMLLDPGSDPSNPSPLLSARTTLRDLSAASGAGHIRSTIHRLRQMKVEVDRRWEQHSGNGRAPRTLDLQIRLYHFLPFGPIYQIGERVMFAGLFINYETSSAGPMLEIHNTGHNPLWRQLVDSFDAGWSERGSRPADPPGQPGPEVARHRRTGMRHLRRGAGDQRQDQ